MFVDNIDLSFEWKLDANMHSVRAKYLLEGLPDIKNYFNFQVLLLFCEVSKSHMLSNQSTSPKQIALISPVFLL